MHSKRRIEAPRSPIAARCSGSSEASVGRRRKDDSQGLPQRVYLRSGSLYYVHPNGKWERIGKFHSFTSRSCTRSPARPTPTAASARCSSAPRSKSAPGCARSRRCPRSASATSKARGPPTCGSPAHQSSRSSCYADTRASPRRSATSRRAGPRRRPRTRSSWRAQRPLDIGRSPKPFQYSKGQGARPHDLTP